MENRLADRYEKAEGPSRELDTTIALELDRLPTLAENPRGISEHGDRWAAPKFTASLDAAMTLRGGRRVILNIAEDDITTAIVAGTQGIGDTPALALCAASLRSIAQKGSV